MPSPHWNSTITAVAASATGAIVAVAVGELLRRWLNDHVDSQVTAARLAQVDSVDELRANMQKLTQVVLQLARTGREDDSPRSPHKGMYERRNSPPDMHAADGGTGLALERPARLDCLRPERRQTFLRLGLTRRLVPTLIIAFSRLQECKRQRGQERVE